jgi:hypothetical protein
MQFRKKMMKNIEDSENVNLKSSILSKESRSTDNELR